MKITPVAMAVHRPGTNPIIGEDALRIELADEGGGPFFLITSADMLKDRSLRVDYEELGALLEAAKRLMEASK